MKNGVKTEATFKVDEINKVVVCKMEVDMQLDKTKVWPNTSREWWSKKAPMANVYGGFTVTAKARCNSTDTFDAELGKRIAESRAKAKAFKISARVYECINKEFKKMLGDVNNRMKACIHEEEMEINHINELIK